MNVLYFGVRSLEYPRNARIRSYLEEAHGARITVFLRPSSSSRLRRYLVSFRQAFSASSPYDLVILSEFSLDLFAFAWLAAKRSKSLLVVDFFVGLYETEVGDDGRTSARSCRAKILNAIDRSAIMASDVCVTDTSVRAERFASLVRQRRQVLALPVGAPGWAWPTGSSFTLKNDGPKKLLYYGSYLPLHGLESFVRAIALDSSEAFEVTMVGSGPKREEIELLVHHLGLQAKFRFLDPVAELQLAAFMESADIIVGIFGSSVKASEVIANKVWQGLYKGKIVVTRASAALDEVSVISQGSLVQVHGGSARDIYRALVEAAHRIQSTDMVQLSDEAGTAKRLEAYVRSRYEETFESIFLSSQGTHRLWVNSVRSRRGR